MNVVGNCLATAVVARWEGQLGSGEPTGLAPVDELPVGDATIRADVPPHTRS